MATISAIAHGLSTHEPNTSYPHWHPSNWFKASIYVLQTFTWYIFDYALLRNHLFDGCCVVFVRPIILECTRKMCTGAPSNQTQYTFIRAHTNCKTVSFWYAILMLSCMTCIKFKIHTFTLINWWKFIPPCDVWANGIREILAGINFIWKIVILMSWTILKRERK